MSIWIWIVFNLFVVAMLTLDLKIFNREAHEISVREALVWSGVWIALSLLFGVVIYIWRGSEAGIAFFAGYLIEKSLSVDNIFVFLMIFAYFGVAPKHQRRILTWGILGAIVLRAIFIFAGVALIEAFHWMIYVFGAFLIYTAYRMVTQEDEAIDPSQNPVVRLFKRFFPVSEDHENGKFFIRRAGKLMATPLFITLLMVEVSDIIFAVDSIPAILAVTTDPFLVYSSNILAILGLRALYFALAGIMEMFQYLHYGLASILGFVGAKMLLSGYVHIPTGVALGVVGMILVISVVASIWRARHQVLRAAQEPAEELAKIRESMKSDSAPERT